VFVLFISGRSEACHGRTDRQTDSVQYLMQPSRENCITKQLTKADVTPHRHRFNAVISAIFYYFVTPTLEKLTVAEYPLGHQRSSQSMWFGRPYDIRFPVNIQ